MDDELGFEDMKKILEPYPRGSVGGGCTGTTQPDCRWPHFTYCMESG